MGNTQSPVSKIKNDIPQYLSDRGAILGFEWCVWVGLVFLVPGLVMYAICVFMVDESKADPESNDYSQFKKTYEATLSFLVLTSVLLIIGIIIYFLFFEEAFLYSQTMATQLGLASQGPRDIRKVAGLLSSYVYPNKKDIAQRNSYANDIMQNLRNAYFQENKITEDSAGRWTINDMVVRPPRLVAPPVVGAPPVVVGAPPVGTGAPPVGTGAPPVGTGAPPVGTGAPPVPGAPPVVVGAPPVGTGAPPVVVGAPPVGTGAPPVGTGAPPVGTGAPPVVVGAPPVGTGRRGRRGRRVVAGAPGAPPVVAGAP